LPAANELNWTFDDLGPLYGGCIESIRFPALGYPGGTATGAIRFSTGYYRLEPEIFPPAPYTWLDTVEALTALQEVPCHLTATLRGHEESYVLTIADEFWVGGYAEGEVGLESTKNIFLFL
jgi:hypothetical protein